MMATVIVSLKIDDNHCKPIQVLGALYRYVPLILSLPVIFHLQLFTRFCKNNGTVLLSCIFKSKVKWLTDQ